MTAADAVAPSIVLDAVAKRFESTSGPVLAVDLPGRGDHPADLASITVDDEVDTTTFRAIVAEVGGDALR